MIVTDSVSSYTASKVNETLDILDIYWPKKNSGVAQDTTKPIAQDITKVNWNVDDKYKIKYMAFSVSPATKFVKVYKTFPSVVYVSDLIDPKDLYTINLTEKHIFVKGEKYDIISIDKIPVLQAGQVVSINLHVLKNLRFRVIDKRTLESTDSRALFVTKGEKLAIDDNCMVLYVNNGTVQKIESITVDSDPVPEFIPSIGQVYDIETEHGSKTQRVKVETTSKPTRVQIITEPKGISFISDNNFIPGINNEFTEENGNKVIVWTPFGNGDRIKSLVLVPEVFKRFKIWVDIYKDGDHQQNRKYFHGCQTHFYVTATEKPKNLQDALLLLKDEKHKEAIEAAIKLCPSFTHGINDPVYVEFTLFEELDARFIPHYYKTSFIYHDNMSWEASKKINMTVDEFFKEALDVKRDVCENTVGWIQLGNAKSFDHSQVDMNITVRNELDEKIIQLQKEIDKLRAKQNVLWNGNFELTKYKLLYDVAMKNVPNTHLYLHVPYVVKKSVYNDLKKQKNNCPGDCDQLNKAIAFVENLLETESC